MKAERVRKAFLAALVGLVVSGTVWAEPVIVPDVVGLSEPDANSVLTAVGLVTGGVSYDYSDSVAAGVVLSQDPVGGAPVPSGSSVDLVVSLGRPTVPDVEGMTVAEANSVINAVDNLSIGDMTYQYSDTVAAGLVLSQDPAAGTAVPIGSTVDLVVSLGRPTVPDVVGMTEADANTAINSVDDLSIGDVTYQYSDTVAAGLVLSQDPAAGTSVPIGTSVDLIVSLGRPTVPDVVGMLVADANTAISAVDNLSIGDITYQPHDTVAAGCVLSQDPAAGTTVLLGSSVDLVVSLGNVYELTVTVFGGNGTVEPNGGFYPAGTVVTLTATPEEPYCLSRWTGTDDDSSYALTNTVTMSGDRFVDVEFRLPHTFFVPGHYAMIQEAIDAAGNCDVVVVGPGAYPGNISFNGKRITVTSLAPDDPCVVAYTVIDGTGEGSSVVTFSGSEDGSCVLSGLTITGGNTPGNGGGICGNGTGATIANCVIRGNHADGDGGGVSDCNGLIVHCTISENSADRGGGVFGVDVGPSMTGCGLSGNSAASDGGGLFCFAAAASILRCTIVGNSADGRGGGMYLAGVGSPQVVNCLVAGNSAVEGGGGIYAGWYAEPTISNCTIVDNTVTFGNGGGVCCSYFSSAVTVNSIVWGNLGLAGAQIALISGDVAFPRPSTLVISYSDVEGGPAAAYVEEGCTLTWGQGSIDGDPLFVGSDGSNYHLMPDSPCVDAGDNSFVPPSAPKDLDGSPRIANGTVDMGAYEVLCYHVDGLDGDDLNDGLSRETAFATIQQGIDRAEDYDAVLVYPAVYTEELDFLGKAIMVQSADEPAVLRAPDYYAVSFYHEEDGNSVLKNLVITDSDVGFWFSGASPTIEHVTVADCNLGADASGGAEPVITNSIFWNNRDGDLIACQGQYSCIENGSAGQGNIIKAPCFVDADNGDYHLRSEGWRWAGGGTGWAWDDVTSPCIDAGNPGTCLGNEPMSVPRDPDNLWGKNIRVNMGAYGGTSQAGIPPHNWTVLGDLNNDGIVDWRDADLWAQYWLAAGGALPGDLDRTGQVDGLDFALLGAGWMQATTWWSCLVPTPPTPDPMRWDYSVDPNGLDGRPWEILLPPYTYWDYGHTMRADPNTTDEGGWWEFYFECTNFEGFESGWVSFPAGPPYTYTVKMGLPALEARFRVKARDLCGNETGWSEALTSLPWEDTTPPAPAPYLLTLEPVAPNTPNAPNTPALMMTASEAHDISRVEYYFQCTSVGGHDSGWQDGVNYTDVNLIVDSNYCYRVKARDKSPNRNETAWSVAVCATANGNDQRPPAPDPMQWDFTVDASGFDGLPREVLLPPYTYWDYGHTMRADPNTTDDSGSFEFYFECKDPFSHYSSGWISFPAGPPYIYTTGAMGPPGYEPRFRVKARDMWGNETAWSEWECSGCPVVP